MYKYILVLCLIPAIAQGQVKYVEKDQPAPFTGYLFTPEKEQEVRKDAEALKYFKLVDESNQRIIQLKDNEMVLIKSQADLWRQQSSELAKQLESEKGASFWRNTLYFGLGAVLTTVLAFGVNKATK